VLRYFGDPAARAECAGCDNCLGTHVAAETASNPARNRKSKQTLNARRGDAAPATDDVVIDGANGALLDRLRILRRAIAKEEQVPAYVVFPDRTLAEMAVRRPRTPVALAGIRGVGPTKLERYGERFLAVVRAADETEAA
jgi:ATP-dependent DNA helicase RecQ